MILDYDDSDNFFIDDEIQVSNIFSGLDITTNNTVFIDIQKYLYDNEINLILKENIKLKWQIIFQKLFYKTQLKKYYLNHKAWIRFQNSF